MSAGLVPKLDTGKRTLSPLIREYLRGRVARGEIIRQSALDMHYSLDQLSTSFGARPIGQLGPRAIDRWLETISHLSPATRREYVSRVRTFCRWLVVNGVVKDDPTLHVPAVRQPRRVPKTLTEAEVGRLLDACPDARARAVIWLMVGCGLRCVEVARLQVDQYDPVARIVIVTGKGGHERRLPVPIEAAEAVDAYLDEVGRPWGPLIRMLDSGQGLAAKTLSGYVRRWLRVAGVKSAALDGRSAHGLRRTAGSDVMDRTGDIRIVQEMLGHARVETTAQHYLRPVPIDRLREAMEGRRYATPAESPMGDVIELRARPA